MNRILLHLTSDITPQILLRRLPLLHLLQKRIEQIQLLEVIDLQYHSRFHKPRPTRDSAAEIVYDSWPANLSRLQSLSFTDDDATPPPPHRSLCHASLRTNGIQLNPSAFFLKHIAPQIQSIGRVFETVD